MGLGQRVPPPGLGSIRVHLQHKNVFLARDAITSSVRIKSEQTNTKYAPVSCKGSVHSLGRTRNW